MRTKDITINLGTWSNAADYRLALRLALADMPISVKNCKRGSIPRISVARDMRTLRSLYRLIANAC